MAPQVAVMWLATTSTMMRTPYLCAVSQRQASPGPTRCPLPSCRWWCRSAGTRSTSSRRRSCPYRRCEWRRSGSVCTEVYPAAAISGMFFSMVLKLHSQACRVAPSLHHLLRQTVLLSGLFEGDVLNSVGVAVAAGVGLRCGTGDCQAAEGGRCGGYADDHLLADLQT